VRILIALTYYRPHVSGLTIYAERLARRLAARGHRVTVLTSRYHPRLPARESMNGVEIVRVPVSLKVSKGVIMPLFGLYAWHFLRQHDVVNVHAPQFEAALLCGLARQLRRPAVLTYHCDLQLPGGTFNRIVETSLGPGNRAAARWADRIVAHTADYATNSSFLSRYLSRFEEILPIIDLPEVREDAVQAFAARWNLQRPHTIGFAARFAAEKGVEYLLRALPIVLREIPDAHIVFTGAYKDTVGEEAYAARLQPLMEPLHDKLTFLDLLPDEEMPNFYASCDVLTMTSLNSTEAFGMAQAEAMICGTPVIGTDIPGVREVVRRTGMGEIVPPHNAEALAQALIRVLHNRSQYIRPRSEIRSIFDPEQPPQQYEALFSTLLAQRPG